MRTEERAFDKAATNLCKGIAIILMYIHHSFYSKDSWGSAALVFTPFTQKQTIAIAHLCKVCVSIFVFLSAFGVYRSSRKQGESAGRFLTERYRPLVFRRYFVLLWNFAAVYIVTQLCSPLIGISRVSAYGESRLGRIVYTLIDGAGLADLFSTPTYNGTWWYMPFAYLLIFLLPLMAIAVDYLGGSMLALALLLPPLLGCDMKATFFRYLIAVVMGLICAKYDLMEILLKKMQKSGRDYLLGMCACLLGIAAMLIGKQRFGHAYLFEGFNAAFICFFGYAFLWRIAGVRQLLELLGKHSMNMFLLHTLVRGTQTRFHAFSYAPRYPVLIILLLLADTLVLSVMLEWLKKKLRDFYRRSSARSCTGPNSS